MKKAYAKPTATKVDFEYKDNVIAQSVDTGTHAKPSHPTACQYGTLTVCTFIHSLGYDCDNEAPASLNL